MARGRKVQTGSKEMPADAKKGAKLRRAIMGRQGEESVSIKPPNMMTAEFRIIGTSPYVQNKFSARVKEQMMATQAAGSAARSKKERKPKDFDALYREAMHVSTEGWIGMPANAFRNGMISQCRLLGFKMTHAKLSVFVEADGWGEDGTPLVKIEGLPEKFVSAARNTTGVIDLRSRPKWNKWAANVRVLFDADQFSVSDIANLLYRVGLQGGMGEGRWDSRNSNGMGWGCFTLDLEGKEGKKVG